MLGGWPCTAGQSRIPGTGSLSTYNRPNLVLHSISTIFFAGKTFFILEIRTVESHRVLVSHFKLERSIIGTEIQWLFFYHCNILPWYVIYTKGGLRMFVIHTIKGENIGIDLWYVADVSNFPNTLLLFCLWFLINCLELTRTDAVFSRIAFGVFHLCRVEKFAKNYRKIGKRIFEKN